MGKLKALLKFVFLIVPFFIVGGIELILLHNRSIKEPAFHTVRIRKVKRKSDQQIFAEFMRRMTK